MKIEKIRQELKKRITEKRYIHTLGVEEKAMELAKKYGIDENLVRVASILHDVAKNMSVQELVEISERNFGDELSKEDLEIIEILHGFVGSLIAKNEFGIENQEILDAIKYHTIGKKELSMIGRIVYIADAIEKNRDYPNVKYLRECVENDLNFGIIEEIRLKVEYLEKCGGKLHRNTLEMKEWLEKERGEEIEKYK